MTNTSLLTSVICGLIAAFLFVSPLSLGGFGLMLSSFTAMPLFIAVLGFGTVAGAIACIVAAAVVTVFMGFIGGLSVLGATLAPAVWNHAHSDRVVCEGRRFGPARPLGALT